MPTDLPTLGAPIMIVGLLAGFFLCFYGNRARRYLIPLRSLLSGATVSLALLFLLMQRDALGSALASPRVLQALGDLLLEGDSYLFSVIALTSVAVGGLLLFALSRKEGAFQSTIVALFTGLSMAIFIFLLLTTFFPLTLNLIVSALVMIVILIFCIADFTSYIAVESAVGGGLLISYLLTRFWHLSFWMFLVGAVLFSALGVFSQMRSITKRKAESESLNVT